MVLKGGKKRVKFTDKDFDDLCYLMLQIFR